MSAAEAAATMLLIALASASARVEQREYVVRLSFDEGAWRRENAEPEIPCRSFYDLEELTRGLLAKDVPPGNHVGATWTSCPHVGGGSDCAWVCARKRGCGSLRDAVEVYLITQCGLRSDTFRLADKVVSAPNGKPPRLEDVAFYRPRRPPWVTDAPEDAHEPQLEPSPVLHAESAPLPTPPLRSTTAMTTAATTTIPPPPSPSLTTVPATTTSPATTATALQTFANPPTTPTSAAPAATDTARTSAATSSLRAGPSAGNTFSSPAAERPTRTPVASAPGARTTSTSAASTLAASTPPLSAPASVKITSIVPTRTTTTASPSRLDEDLGRLDTIVREISNARDGDEMVDRVVEHVEEQAAKAPATAAAEEGNRPECNCNCSCRPPPCECRYRPLPCPACEKCPEREPAVRAPKQCRPCPDVDFSKCSAPCPASEPCDPRPFQPVVNVTFNASLIPPCPERNCSFPEFDYSKCSPTISPVVNSSCPDPNPTFNLSCPEIDEHLLAQRISHLLIPLLNLSSQCADLVVVRDLLEPLAEQLDNCSCETSVTSVPSALPPSNTSGAQIPPGVGEDRTDAALRMLALRLLLGELTEEGREALEGSLAWQERLLASGYAGEDAERQRRRLQLLVDLAARATDERWPTSAFAGIGVTGTVCAVSIGVLLWCLRKSRRDARKSKATQREDARWREAADREYRASEERREMQEALREVGILVAEELVHRQQQPGRPVPVEQPEGRSQEIERPDEAADTDESSHGDGPPDAPPPPPPPTPQEEHPPPQRARATPAFRLRSGLARAARLLTRLPFRRGGEVVVEMERMGDARNGGEEEEEEEEVVDGGGSADVAPRLETPSVVASGGRRPPARREDWASALGASPRLPPPLPPRTDVQLHSVARRREDAARGEEAETPL